MLELTHFPTIWILTTPNTNQSLGPVHSLSPVVLLWLSLFPLVLPLSILSPPSSLLLTALGVRALPTVGCFLCLFSLLLCQHFRSFPSLSLLGTHRPSQAQPLFFLFQARRHSAGAGKPRRFCGDIFHGHMETAARVPRPTEARQSPHLVAV